MFAQHKIGIILTPHKDELIRADIPEYVDRMYIMHSEDGSFVKDEGAIYFDESVLTVERIYSMALQKAVSDGMHVICILGAIESLPPRSLEGALNLVVWNKTKYLHLGPLVNPSWDLPASEINHFSVLDGNSSPHFRVTELNSGLTVLTTRMAEQLAEILATESKRTLVAIHGTGSDISPGLFIIKKYSDDVLVVLENPMCEDEEAVRQAGAICIPIGKGDSFTDTARDYAKEQHYDKLILIPDGNTLAVTGIPSLLNPLGVGQAEVIYHPE